MLYEHAENSGGYSPGYHGQDEAAGALVDCVANIAAEQKKRPMREIENAHQAEDHRQPARQEEEQRASGESVECLENPESHSNRFRGDIPAGAV